MKNIFLASLFMMHMFSLFSQTKGLVLDLNNMPINQVDVYFADQNIQVYEDAYGSFMGLSLLKVRFQTIVIFIFLNMDIHHKELNIKIILH